MGLAGPLGQTLVAAVGMGVLTLENIIASCKASVAATRAAVSPVDGAGKGTGPTTSSPWVSWPAPGTSTSVGLTCGKPAMAVVKRKQPVTCT